MIDLNKYASELNTELESILAYWMEHTIDNANGGFYGSIDNDNSIHTGAQKGLVLNARILWSFSAAYNYSHNEKYLHTAERAYQYLKTFFTDKESGGAYWSVNALGNPLSDRKQIYGLAFYLYGLSEYHAASKDATVLDEAIQLFRLIEEKSFDEERKGYYEAFARDWQPLADLRLSDKDANEKKTMNTHLHIIEAYANLYKQWPDELLRRKIVQLLEVFDEYIIDKTTGHLALFFDEAWNERHDVISYGHDIEAAWLLQQCAEVVNDNALINKFKNHALHITNAAMEGLDTDGGLWYEFDPSRSALIKEKHWWPQAEAMIGFFNAWELSGNENYLQSSINSWHFIKKFFLDKKNGEWFWGINADYSIMKGQDKAGFWKCPYHNSRACLEIVKRINAK